jgi:Ca2+-binding RTX toxin-like protein
MADTFVKPVLSSQEQSRVDQLLKAESQAATSGSGKLQSANFQSQRVAALTDSGETLGIKLTGTAGDDTIVGTQGNDDISALGGNDTVIGLGGNDIVNAGAGDDNVVAGAGDDQVNGGLGVDVLLGGSGIDGINGNEGNDSLFGDDGNDTLRGGAGVDKLFGGNGNDQLFGEVGNDQLNGDTGNDIADGGVGNDVVFGGAGNDNLKGSAGNDQVIGGSGDDSLFGDNGNDRLVGVDPFVPEFGLGKGEIDRLTGGANNDTFALGGILPNGAKTVFYNDGNSTTKGTQDYALITDFGFSGDGKTLGVDKIELAGSQNSYSLGASPSGLPSGTGIFFGEGELIGIVQNISPSSLSLANANQFTFV